MKKHKRLLLNLLVPALFLTGCNPLDIFKEKEETSDRYIVNHLINKSVTFNDLNLLLRYVSISKNIQNNDGSKNYVTDNYFTTLVCLIKNPTQEDKTINQQMFTFHTGVYTYSPSAVNNYFSNTLYNGQMISHGLQKEIHMIFETPNDYNENDFLEIKPDESSEETITITLQKDQN